MKKRILKRKKNRKDGPPGGGESPIQSKKLFRKGKREKEVCRRKSRNCPPKKQRLLKETIWDGPDQKGTFRGLHYQKTNSRRKSRKR